MSSSIQSVCAVLSVLVASCVASVPRDAAPSDRLLAHPIDLSPDVLGADYPGPEAPSILSGVGGQSNGVAEDLLGDLSAWNGSDHETRLSTAECIEKKYPEFRLGQLEKVTRDGAVREVAIFLRHGHPEELYALVPGWRLGVDHTGPIPPFLMARQTVSDAEWREVMAPSASLRGQFDQPAVGVSWIDAARYCMRRRLELPTEDEWEHACRAGERMDGASDGGGPRFWTPDHDLAWPRPVTATNGLALADMPGRLWELTETRAASIDLAGPGVVARGGVSAGGAEASAVGARIVLGPDESAANVGVRPIFRLHAPYPFPPSHR